MEIIFNNKSLNTYTELGRVFRKTQETAESVVPDVNDDIGRIVSLQSQLYLKSKEFNGRGITVGGELNASVLYITENEGSVSFVNLSKSFSLEFETADAADEQLSQVKLHISNCEARVLNPRKVSVCFEVSGELCYYAPQDIILETTLDSNESGVHTLEESCGILAINAVCEKTFSISEQLIFPSGKPVPAQLIAQQLEYIVTDTQFIGTKAIVKGNVSICVNYKNGDDSYPISTEFSLPFSQMVDTGVDANDSCSIIIQPTSAYYRLLDTINGEKALECELHALMQIVCRKRETVRYISDAYSNLMPVDISRRVAVFTHSAETQRLRLCCEEHINIADDCADVLCVFPSITDTQLSGGKCVCSIQLDIIYRSRSGALSAAKRNLKAEGECTTENPRLLSSRIADSYIRPDGTVLECRINTEHISSNIKSIEISGVEQLNTLEEKSYNFGDFPSLSLVRSEGESLWELAKRYHSSVELISLASESSENGNKLLLIPKCI